MCTVSPLPPLVLFVSPISPAPRVLTTLPILSFRSEPYDPYLPRGGSSANPSGEPGRPQGNNKTAAIQQQIDDTVGIMRENITRVAERGERLDVLQDKTGEFCLVSSILGQLYLGDGMGYLAGATGLLEASLRLCVSASLCSAPGYGAGNLGCGRQCMRLRRAVRSCTASQPQPRRLLRTGLQFHDIANINHPSISPR